MHIPAIVGAFPQPFRNGDSGRRLPTRVECEEIDSQACKDTSAALESHGVVTTQAVIGSSTGEKSLRVLVGPWKEIRNTITGRQLDRGPANSGVFAHFDSSGALSLLDGEGRAARAAPAGSGLVAATEQEGGGVVWVVTGADDAGTARAAKALDPEVLRNAFAVAATPAGPVKLPVGGF